MVGQSYLVIVSAFLVYYILVLLFEKRFINNPKDIIEKFLAMVLAYAGVSLIYFSFTGEPLIGGDVSEYYVYIFLIGFISFIWAIPNLLSEFKFFKKFMPNEGKTNKKRV